ncbi:Proteins of 100 residues with WXG [Micromonospora pallida]|uniref:Proteins of 100 residues with WXG n=1 Tax=Micromonospora pallida TaxID=145854 RepID=A0A1C6TEH1_9ACTN|nr:WXG100 family type VII secretion target [Micromonospora pallida]SCL39845.1 Proteins of 100 residues with WXG [Micromonospora pallida]
MTRPPSGAERIETWLGPAGAAYGVIRPIVDFLANPLDEVTGDPDQLREKAKAWQSAAERMEDFAQAELAARRGLLSYWEGDAATAFNTEMNEVNRSLGEIGADFEFTVKLLEASAEGAQQAQELVEQIVRELIAWLIITVVVALASAWITLGASVAAASAAGAIEAGLAGTRAAAVALRLANLLRQVATVLRNISNFARAYKLTTITKVGVRNWMTARYASSLGYQLLATNWVIKQTIAKPVLGPGVDKVTEADRPWKLPPVL